MRHGNPCAVELAGQADIQASLPIFGMHLIDRRGRTGNAGIIDKNIDAAEMIRSGVNETRDSRAIGDVALHGKRIRKRGVKAGKRRGIDITNSESCAFTGKGARNFKSDPPGSGRNDHSQTVNVQVHAGGFLLKRLAAVRIDSGNIFDRG